MTIVSDNKPKLEMERKFLLPGMPSKEILSNVVHISTIEQLYLHQPENNGLIRLRRMSTTVIGSGQDAKVECFMTIKGDAPIYDLPVLIREEYETRITEDTYNRLAAGRPKLHKGRYSLPYKGHMIVIDKFRMHVDNSLIIAEVEFDSEEEALAFEPPEWFGEEVTHQLKYRNDHIFYEYTGLSPDSPELQF